LPFLKCEDILKAAVNRRCAKYDIYIGMLRLDHIAIFLFLLPMGCLPQGQGFLGGVPEIAFINGPRSARLAGLAEEVEAAVFSLGLQGYAFSRGEAVRIRERVRGFGRGRLRSDAVSLGKNIGAEFTVLVGAPLFQRDVRLVPSHVQPNPLEIVREVAIRVKVKVTTFEVSTGFLLHEYESTTIQRVRIEDTSQALPSLSEDPDLREAREMAVDEVARTVKKLLE
jgi:hypothetical protein